MLVGFAIHTGLTRAIHVALLIGDCVNCQSHRAIYIYIALTAGQYGIYCPGGAFERPRKQATKR